MINHFKRKETIGLPSLKQYIISWSYDKEYIWVVLWGPGKKQKIGNRLIAINWPNILSIFYKMKQKTSIANFPESDG